MKTAERVKNFRLLGLYVLNRYDYRKFGEDLSEIAPGANEGYTDEKWSALQRNPLSFLVSYSEMVPLIFKRIDEENYKG